MINIIQLLYNLFLEDKKLLQLTKKQSTKLYDRSCELMETTKNHNKTIHELDNDIELKNREIKNLSVKAVDINPGTIIDEIQTHVKTNDDIDSKKISLLFENTIKKLYNQFNDIAYRNGFEMPDIKGEIK